MNRIGWIVVIVAAFGLGAPLAAQDLEVELQRAVQREMAGGDLKAAITEYRQLVDRASRPGGNRAVTAKALLRLAECHERLGQAEGRAVLETITRKFADQTDVAAAARRKLDQRSAREPAKALSTRLVHTVVGRGPDIESVTPDGRLATGADWANGDLIVRDLGTGQVTRLLPGTLDGRSMGPEAAEGRYVGWSQISPDGRQIAFARYGDTDNPSQGQLWVMPVAPGSKPRLVSRNPEYRNITPQAWSNDGTSLLVNIERVDEGYQLAWMSVSDGAVKVLKSFGWDPAPDYRLRLSPDGRHIAYSANVREKSPDRSIFILAADGSRETILTQTAGKNESPTWSPDGRHVLFVSNRAGSYDLWAIPVDGRKATGPAIRIKKDIGRVVDLGMTRSGSLFYTLRDIARDRLDSVTVADMPPTSPPRTATAAQASVGLRPSWSPDGEALAFTRRTESSLDHTLVVHRVATGEEQVFSTERFRPAAPTWLREEGKLVALADRGGTKRALVVVDVKGGASKELIPLDATVVAPGIFGLSPDAQAVFFAAYGPKPAVNDAAPLDRIQRLEVTGGSRSEIFHGPGRSITSIRVSPDGRWIAFLSQDSNKAYLSRIAVDGTGLTELASDLRAAVGGLAWDTDGRSLLIAKREAANRWTVVRLGLNGETPRPTGIEATDPVQSIDVDRRRGRLVYGSVRTIYEFWALENILSVLR